MRGSAEPQGNNTSIQSNNPTLTNSSAMVISRARVVNIIMVDSRCGQSKKKIGIVKIGIVRH